MRQLVTDADRGGLFVHRDERCVLHPLNGDRHLDEIGLLPAVGAESLGEVLQRQRRGGERALGARRIAAIQPRARLDALRAAALQLDPVIVCGDVDVVGRHRVALEPGPGARAVGVVDDGLACTVGQHRERPRKGRVHDHEGAVARMVAQRQPASRRRRPIEAVENATAVAVRLMHHEPAGLGVAGGLEECAADADCDCESSAGRHRPGQRHLQRHAPSREYRGLAVDGDRVDAVAFQVERDRRERPHRHVGARSASGERLLARRIVDELEVDLVADRVDVGESTVVAAHVDAVETDDAAMRRRAPAARRRADGSKD